MIVVYINFISFTETKKSISDDAAFQGMLDSLNLQFVNLMDSGTPVLSVDSKILLHWK